MGRGGGKTKKAVVQPCVTLQHSLQLVDDKKIYAVKGWTTATAQYLTNAIRVKMRVNSRNRSCVITVADVA